MKLKDIIKEVKIQDPYRIIKITPEGELSIKLIHLLENIRTNFNIDLSDIRDLIDSNEKMSWANFLLNSIKEKAILPKGTTIEHFIKTWKEVYGTEDEDEIKDYLVQLMKYNYIYKIKI
jgi:hypothetical protein